MIMTLVLALLAAAVGIAVGISLGVGMALEHDFDDQDAEFNERENRDYAASWG